MSVKSILTHPNFQFPKNDVALLKLSNNLEFNDAVQPIFLPSSNATKYDLLFEELIFAGYGSEEVDIRAKKVNIMKKLEVDLTISTCNNHLYQVDDEKYDSLLFSSTHGLWFGDSGGPLMKISSNFTNSEVVGIAMALETCSNGLLQIQNEDTVSIYTSVSFHVPWIQKNLENFDDYTNLNLDWKIATGILILELHLVFFVVVEPFISRIRCY